ncbi:hypothetical protein [Nostoc sp. C052]|nr:hypothetical protein [Nostoc sp. C052]
MVFQLSSFTKRSLCEAGRSHFPNRHKERLHNHNHPKNAIALSNI